MGWQDRDYARWTDEERRRFLGVGASRASASRRSVGVSECATVAVLVSAAVFALGHLPRGHPLVPELRFSVPMPHTSAAHRPPAVTATLTRPRIRRIAVPRSGRSGSSLTFRGTVPDGEEGVVRLDATYGGAWRRVARVNTVGGAYRVTVRLARRGLLHLRLVYPDGSRAVGSIRVR